MAKLILLLMFTVFLTGCAGSKTAPAYDYAEAGETGSGTDMAYEMPDALQQTTDTQDAVCETGGEEYMSTPEMRERMYAPYEPFGMVYDKDHNILTYEGESVRWFEDYYSLGDGTYAGTDFFDKTGTIDVYAERDFSKRTVSSDGSYDPGGELTGLKKFSQEEFDKRDIRALLQPKEQEATTSISMEDGLNNETNNRKIAAEYSPFGIAYYDTPNGGWFYKGEKIRSFRDVLTSNGESLSSGKFSGVLRSFGSSTGTVDLAAVRDYERPDAQGHGTLTGIEILELSEEPSNIILSESPSSAP